MLDHIDEDQLLEVYGGKLKLPEKIWPPVDTYSPEVRSNIQPILPVETNTDHYLYEPELNPAKKQAHSSLEIPLTSYDPNSDDLVVASEGTPITLKGYRKGMNPKHNFELSQENHSLLQKPNTSNNLKEHSQPSSDIKSPIGGEQATRGLDDVKVNVKEGSEDLKTVDQSANPTKPRKKCTCTLI